MSESNRRTGVRLEGPPPVPTFPVTAHESSPGNYVFVEARNDDAWIASDHTVPAQR